MAPKLINIFGDNDVLEEKMIMVLSWIKQQVMSSMSATCQEDCNDNFKGTVGHREHLVEALLGTMESENWSKIQFTNNEASLLERMINSIKIEALAGGATNFSLHAWVDRLDENGKIAKLTPGVFIKLGLPYARWAGPKKPCNVSRFDREYHALRCLGAICPGASSRPLVCGSSGMDADGARFFVSEFFSEKYETIRTQFQRGDVNVRQAETVGIILGKFHILAPGFLGGREAIFDRDAQLFLLQGHYQTLRVDVEAYLNMDKSNNEFPIEGRPFCRDRKICQKHSNQLKQREDEILRALDRHVENFLNPPRETATYTHLDVHFMNILVPIDREVPTESHFSGNEGPDFDSHEAGDVKLLDMELSNWGPAGADLGWDMGSAYLFAFVHCRKESLESSDSVIASIKGTFKAYFAAYKKYALEQGKCKAIIQHSLHRIVVEAIGWSGIMIFRFTSPSLFLRFCISDILYSLSESVKQELKQIVNKDTGEDGLEMVREYANAFALKSLLLGFGDETAARLAKLELQPERWIELPVEELLDEYILDMVKTRNRFHSMLTSLS